MTTELHMEAVRIECQSSADNEPAWGVDVTLQRCADTLWITVRDDDAQTHGTICRGRLDTEMLSSEDAAGLLGTSAAEAEVLLGDREDPLTNILSMAIVRQCATVTPKPSLLCIALGKETKGRLHNGERRRSFVSNVLQALNTLLLNATEASLQNEED